LQIKKAFSGVERPTTYSIILIFSSYLDQVSRGNSDIGYQPLIYVAVPLASGPLPLKRIWSMMGARRGLTSSRADSTDANGAWSFTTGKLSNAIHSFKAKAVDIAGNVGASPGVALYGTTANDTILDEA
jgi:hypothetical protein